MSIRKGNVYIAGSGVLIDNDTINKNAQNQLQVKDNAITNTKINSTLKAQSISSSPTNDKLATESAVYNYVASGVNGSARPLDDVDLNTITNTGFYSCNVCTNRPTANNGNMLVLKNAFASDNTIQIYWTFVADKMWVRHKDNGSWGVWSSVIKSDSVATQISSSSTNNEVAGAKAVYDYIQSLDATEVSY